MHPQYVRSLFDFPKDNRLFFLLWIPLNIAAGCLLHSIIHWSGRLIDYCKTCYRQKKSITLFGNRFCTNLPLQQK
jgi:hypothetical protein